MYLPSASLWTHSEVNGSVLCLNKSGYKQSKLLRLRLMGEMSSTHLCILLFTFAQVLIKLSWGLLSVLSQLSVLLKACLRSKAETSYYLTPAEEWLKTEKEKYMMNEENRSEQNRHFFHMKFLKQNHLAWVRRVNLRDDIYFMRASLVTHLIKISASVFNHLWAQDVDIIKLRQALRWRRHTQ